MNLFIELVVIAIAFVAFYYSRAFLLGKVKERCLEVLIEQPLFLNEIQLHIVKLTNGCENYHNRVLTAALEDLIWEGKVKKRLDFNAALEKQDWKYQFTPKKPRKDKRLEDNLILQRLKPVVPACHARAPS